MHLFSRLGLLCFLLATLAATAGCSVLLDFTECSSDRDCEGLGGGPWVCGADNTCVAATAECRSDSDCTAPRSTCLSGICVEPDGLSPDVMSDTADTSDLDDDTLPTSCSRHAECRTIDPDTFCSAATHTCVSAVTAECPFFDFPAGAENVVFVGSIIPTMPPYDTLALPLQQAVQLAIADFNSAGGLPGGRKVAWVGCDSRGSSETAQIAARHLVDVIGVPAIIGPVLSTSFIDVVTNVTAPAGVFAITPSATSPSITGLDPLAWRNIPSDVYQANAFVDRLEQFGTTRAVVLVRDDAYGNGLLTLTIDPLRALLGQSNVLFLNYPDPLTLPDNNAVLDAFSSVASQAVTQFGDADTVVLFGTPEAVDLMKVYLGALASAQISPPGPPPRFVFSHGAVPVLPRAVAETNDLFLDLVEGISPEIFVAENIVKFRTRFAARYQVEPINSASLAYDAAFTVLFSMSSLPRDQAITGADVAAGIANLVDKDNGTLVSFGDDNFISTARTVLGNGMTVDLRGVSSQLDYDPDTHELRMNYIGWDVIKFGEDYELSPGRAYVLDPAPETGGTWIDL